MMRRGFFALIALAAVGGGLGLSAGAGGYEELTRLFEEWRTFQRPPLLDGIPDYGASAMARQHRELPAWQKRLSAIDTRGWPVPQQVDWHLVRAEMNGLDFDHRVLQAVGQQPRLLRHGVPVAERPAGARGPLVLGRHRAVELHVPAVRD